MTNTTNRPKQIKWIAILIALTFSRFSVVTYFPGLEMLGGPDPNEWLGPWATDTTLGLLAPLIAYLAYKKTGLKLWGGLIAYNCIGAFDYANGLLTEYLSPQVSNPPEMIFGAIGLFFCIQLVVIYLLFNKNVINHFSQVNS
jgi:hypothetical protein